MNTTSLYLSSLLLASVFADASVAPAEGDVFVAPKQQAKRTWMDFFLCRKAKEVEEVEQKDEAEIEVPTIDIPVKKDTPRNSPHNSPRDIPLPKVEEEKPEPSLEKEVQQAIEEKVEAAAVVDGNKVQIEEAPKEVQTETANQPEIVNLAEPAKQTTPAKKASNNSSSSYSSASSDDDSCFKVAAQTPKTVEEQPIKPFVVAENASAKVGLSMVSFVAVAAALVL